MPFSEPGASDRFTPLSDAYLADETALIAQLVEVANISDNANDDIQSLATILTRGLLEDAHRLSAVDSFLSEYELSSQEGVLLMRLAESLLRTPDTGTTAYLLRDKIAAGRWWPHMSAPHALVTLGTPAARLA